MTVEAATNRYAAARKHAPNQKYGAAQKYGTNQKYGAAKKTEQTRKAGPTKTAEQTEKQTREKTVLYAKEIQKVNTHKVKDALPYDVCKESMLEGFRQYIKMRISSTALQRRSALKEKLLAMPELTPPMYNYALPIIHQRLGGYMFGTTPIIPLTVRARLQFGAHEWQAYVRKEFDAILASTPDTVQPYPLGVDYTTADEPRYVLSSPIPLDQVLRSGFPDVDAFYAELNRVRKLVAKDMAAMASLIRRIILRYASHGLFNSKPVRFHPADLIPLESQIRETDFLDIIDVRPLDRSIPTVLSKNSDLCNFFRGHHLDYMYCRVLLLDQTTSLPPGQHKAWHDMLESVKFKPELRALKHAFHTRKFAMADLDYEIMNNWYKGKLFHRTLKTLCKILIWCHLAPEEEQLYYESKQGRAQSQAVHSKPGSRSRNHSNASSRSSSRSSSSLTLRMKRLTHHLKELVINEDIIGEVILSDLTDIKDENGEDYSIKEKETLCFLSTSLRRYAPRRNDPDHPLMHIPFVVMANTVFWTLGYSNLAQDVAPTIQPTTILPLRLTGHTIYEMFLDKETGLFSVEDKNGVKISSVSHAAENEDLLFRLFFKRKVLERLCDSHDIISTRKRIIITPDNELVVEGYSRMKYTAE
ncbi:hypothetical protein BCR43DRAFT_522231 [Syncephalastrum racemosum]|uniref:Uncharacterized protein n=1 Tax=Syncephalastrum racemosum TaxID=13706 RepID=A0A1X2HPX5_SYNRA|nr:hypothetical protein BCR43DRAFT_522231 [Syncephalastrum racemosum]